jgi:hypothetical protein
MKNRRSIVAGFRASRPPAVTAPRESFALMTFLAQLNVLENASEVCRRAARMEWPITTMSVAEIRETAALLTETIKGIAQMKTELLRRSKQDFDVHIANDNRFSSPLL